MQFKLAVAQDTKLYKYKSYQYDRNQLVLLHLLLDKHTLKDSNIVQMTEAMTVIVSFDSLLGSFLDVIIRWTF